MDLAREAVYDKYQENSIEFLLDYAPDVILLYMVYVHYWLSSLLYDSSNNPNFTPTSNHGGSNSTTQGTD